MENENLETAAPEQGETLGQAGEIEIVDTSSANFQKENYGGGMNNDAFGDDMFDAPSQKESNQHQDYQDDGEQQDNLDSDAQESGNPYFDAYVEWASSRGLEVKSDDFDLESFNEESMEEAVGRYYFEKYSDKTDPRIKHLIENNVDLNQYVQHQQVLEQYIAAKPEDVFKANLYEHLYNDLYQQGALKFDQNQQLTQESLQFLQKQVEDRAQLIGEDAIIARGEQMKEYYKQQLQDLPEQLKEQQLQQYKEQVNHYNQQVDNLITSKKESLKQSKSLVVDFSGQSEKEDFLDYVSQNLKSVEEQGQYKTPFLHKLQNDDDYLFKMLRLSYLLENGYFTDVKNAVRKESFEKLGLFPKVGKGRSAKKGGRTGKVNGIEIMDTSEADYQKNYLK